MKILNYGEALSLPTNKFCAKIIGLFYIVLLITTIPVISFSQESVIVFSENFDNGTSVDPWPYHSQGWISSGMWLQPEEGHGKVLTINHPKGAVGTQSGIGNYRIPLDSAYKELYLSFEYYLEEDFDFGFGDGRGGGKFFAGFAGGSMANIPHRFSVDDDGWVSMFIWVEDGYRTYNYFKGTYYQPGAGWPYGDDVGPLPDGEWRRVTMRLRINDGDQHNGLLEVFDNDTLVYQQIGTKVVNSVHPEYLIEHIYLNNFWGGSGEDYVSPKNQIMQFDNLMAYYYPEGSPEYREGPSEAGRVINVPSAISYHPDPPNRFRETTYTEANGTIESHCGFYQPVMFAEGFQTIEIQIEGATYIDVNITKFSYDPGVNYEGYQQILKIYEGTGSSKVLKKTYRRGVAISPGTVTLSENSATIEWQAGVGQHNGFTIEYSSDRTGPGENYQCGYIYSHQIDPQDWVKDSIPENYELYIQQTGNGKVFPASGRIDEGTEVTLTASADPGWMFTGWTGSETNDQESITITMDSDKMMVANFIKEPFVREAKINFTYDASYSEPGWTSVLGTESFLVTLDNNIFLDIASGALLPGNEGEQQSVYPENVGGTFNFTNSEDQTPVELVFSGLDADQIYMVDIFSGVNASQVSGTQTTAFTIGQETVSIDPAENRDSLLTISNVAPDASGKIKISIDNPDGYNTYINAIVLKRMTSHYLTVEMVGEGSVSLSPGYYTIGQELSITAFPDAGWAFENWSGDLSGTDSKKSFQMDSDKHIIANFSLKPETDTVALINFTFENYLEPGWINVLGDQDFPVNLGHGVSMELVGEIAGGPWGEPSTIFPYRVGSKFNAIEPDYETPLLFTVKGLDPEKKYIFEFFSSRDDATANDNRTTYFVTGGDTIAIKPIGNTDQMATFYSLVPSAAGDIVWEMFKTPGIYGYINAMIIRVDTGTGSKNYETRQLVKAYPVPANDALILENLPLESRIAIYNIKGNKILDARNRNKSRIELDVGDLTPGIYILKVAKENEYIQNIRLIKN